MKLLALSALFLLAGTADARSRDDWKAATPAGPAVRCVPLQQIRETRVRDDRTIDFFMRGKGNRVYRNTLPQSCPSLGFEQRFAYKTSLSELCSVDIITVLYSTPPLRGASCGLGTFQPVSGVAR